MKQGEIEAVTTYLGCFHQNLHQIQAINANYFTVPQIFNQFIHGLRSNILQHVRPLHPGTLQDAVTCAKDFESTKSEANYTQAINLVMNRSSELDSKLENLHNDAIIKETLIVPKINHVYLHRPINSDNRKHVSATIVVNKDISKLTVAIPNSKSVPKSKPTCLLTSDAVISLSVSGVSSSNLSTAITSNLSTTAATNNLLTPANPNTTPKLTTQWNPKTKNDSTELEIGDNSPSTNPQFFTATIWNPNSQNYLSLLVTSENVSTNNLAFAQKQPLTNNILPVTITEDEFLVAIFPFKFKGTTAMPLFSGAALEAKSITTMYIDAKVEGQSIKLILNSVDRAANTRIITADGVTKTPIGEIDNFPFEVNGIVTPIKVLVMEATQYQALVNNDWPFKGQHICVPVMCDYFKTPPRGKLLIELEEKKEKPTWEAYQVSWADADHNKLPPILFCPHDDDELWQMAIAKIEGVSSEEIRTIKNNPPEPIELDWNAKPVINFLEPEEFHEHYQNLAPTREKQKQWLA
ncbi:hypothetical protein G9A89_021234 [Geosiphon pyriformis]|nr:hypothetical protein G9A89_021234 [Geosiphon pyriformis]